MWHMPDELRPVGMMQQEGRPWAITQAWCKRKTVACDMAVAYRAARQWAHVYARVGGGAPTRSAPLMLANEAVSIKGAQRSGHKHRCEHSPALCPPRCATPYPNVIQCHSAVRSIDWNALLLYLSAQHGVPADRFARKIVRFLM